MRIKRYPVLMVLLAILTTLFCPLNKATALQTDQDRVAVFLVNQGGKPIPGVSVSLLIYKFNERGTTVEAYFAGSCTTDQGGRCEIIVSADAPKDASGFLKGALDLGERGKRSVIWPGGLLEVPIKLNEAGKVQTDTEAKAFDNDPPDEMTIIEPRPPVYWVGIFLAVIFLGLAFVLYYESSRKTP